MVELLTGPEAKTPVTFYLELTGNAESVRHCVKCNNCHNLISFLYTVDTFILSQDDPRKFVRCPKCGTATMVGPSAMVVTTYKAKDGTNILVVQGKP